MAIDQSKKKSRTAKALLLLVVLIAVFAVGGALLSLLTEDSDSVVGSWFSSGNKIGVVELEGTITSSDKILEQLKKFRKKKSVKAIVLRINSPGGAVAPAQEIYREIGKVRKKKPVVASIESVGASAAYYIASNCDRIVCSPGSITGSIGVIMILAEAHKLINRFQVDINVIKAGKFKDMGSVIRPLTEEERKILESFAKEIHEQFIADVAKGRKGKIDIEKLRKVANGSFFTGAKAKKLGLVDTMGNFYDAVKIAGKLGGIVGEPELVYSKKKWETYLEYFFGSLSRALLKAADRVRIMQPAPMIR
jgi:protease-4